MCHVKDKNSQSTFVAKNDASSINFWKTASVCLIKTELTQSDFDSLRLHV